MCATEGVMGEKEAIIAIATYYNVRVIIHVISPHSKSENNMSIWSEEILPMLTNKYIGTIELYLSYNHYTLKK